MELGQNSKWSKLSSFDNDSEYYKYELNVEKDMFEVKQNYPFTSEVIFPFSNFQVTKVYEIYLVNKNLVEITLLSKKECKEKMGYRKVVVIIPPHYKKEGCIVFIQKFFTKESIPYEHVHINGNFSDCYEFCAGVPKSFKKLENVILENCRTTENYLTQIDSYLKKRSREIHMIEFRHGAEGEKEYGNQRNKYETRRNNKK